MPTGPDLPVPQHGWRFVYWLGGVLGVLLVVALLSGSVLAISYDPTPQQAHASVRRIVDEIPAGAWVRGVHVWASHLAVVALLLHLLTVLLTAGFRRPRQWTWVLGIGLAWLVMSFAFTGRVLPQDEVAAGTARSGLTLLGSLPGIGGLLERLATGGVDGPGPMLTRFHALHTILLPGALVLVVAGHVLLVHRHGLSIPPWIDATTVHTRSLAGHLRREARSWAVVTAAVFVLAVAAPVGVGPPFDPSHPVPPDARPEWYFRPIDGLVRARGSTDHSVFALAIVIATAVSASLPFWWRRRDRRSARARRE